MSGDWRALGACRQADPELFFPVGTTGPAIAQANAAKAICRACSVTAQCLSWALSVGDIEGICGGTSGDERRAMLQPTGALQPA